MRIYENGPRRRYADVLRSLGARIEAMAPRALVLLETDAGFLLRVTRVAATGSLRTGAAMEKVEESITDAQIAVAIEEGYGRRGSQHVAATLERELRAIGHRIDQDGASDITLILHEGEWLLRYLPPDSTGSYAFLEFGAEEMEGLIASSMQPAPPRPRGLRILGR